MSLADLETDIYGLAAARQLSNTSSNSVSSSYTVSVFNLPHLTARYNPPHAAASEHLEDLVVVEGFSDHVSTRESSCGEGGLESGGRREWGRVLDLLLPPSGLGVAPHRPAPMTETPRLSVPRHHR